MGWLVAYFMAAALGGCLWWAIFGISCSMNGLSGERYGLWLPFVGLWQDLCWRFKPGAAEDWIRRTVGRFPDSEGWIGDYTYAEIREGNLYAEASREILAPWNMLFLEHVVLPGSPVLMVGLVHLCYLCFRTLFLGS